MIRLTGLKLSVDHEKSDIYTSIYDKLGEKVKIKEFKISNKAIDARKKPNIYIVYSVDIEVDNEDKYVDGNTIKKLVNEKYVIPNLSKYKGLRPVIVGSGPGGIFAGLILAKAGLNPIILERGKAVDDRITDVYNFFNTGKLDVTSNVQFGEGGAGTFSDGKLTTNSHNSRIRIVIDELINAGADENISYIAKPHIGTDVLVNVVKKVREKIEKLGGEYRFLNQLVDIKYTNDRLKALVVKKADGSTYEIETDYCILAIGHSARDTIYMLKNRGVYLTKKSFAVGFRIEHKQGYINECQYGKNYSKKLPPAEYKINVRTKTGRGVYTFCMCPGGVVVPASSEQGYLAINGMSYNKRNLENANSAVLVNVEPSDLPEDVMSGIEFQREIEHKAFLLGGSNYKAPVQLAKDYIAGVKTTKLLDVKPSYSIGYTLADLNEILPKYLNDALKEGLVGLNRKLKDFSNKSSVLTGVESRSSSPVRINRDKDTMYCNILGLIPCGEGAGYAGGIMTAAVDGIKCSEKILEEIQNDI